jgi:hypothetical protein
MESLTMNDSLDTQKLQVIRRQILGDSGEVSPSTSPQWRNHPRQKQDSRLYAVMRRCA